MRRFAVPVLFLLAAPACGGKVVVDGNPSSVAGGGGTSGISGTSAASGTNGTSAASGSGGAPNCTVTHDTLKVSLGSWDGSTYQCGTTTGEVDFSAMVVDTDNKGFLALDSCSPAADCLPLGSKLAIKAPGIMTDIPKGTYVRIHLAITPLGNGCEERIQIKNLPVWDGAPNPVMPGDFVWFLGVESAMTAFADTPFTAAPEPLGCFPGQVGCGSPENYRWRFQLANNPADPGVAVQMGETAYWGASVPSGFQYVSAHNLRSFTLDACETSTEFAYWMKHEYPLD